MSTNEKVELETLLKMMRSRGYQPMGILFHDAKTQLLGIAPLASVPDAWVEMIVKRLSGVNGSTQWDSVGSS